MKRFYLSGQTNFGNRGCEALVRSTLQLLKQRFGDQVEVLVPSFRPDLDAAQWIDAKQNGVRFVRAMPFPVELKVWSRLLKLTPRVARTFIPRFGLPADIVADLRSCDALLVIGGDNITLDYGLASLAWHVGFADCAHRMGLPVMVWAASVGPFKSEPRAEAYVARFLNRIECITVRESISLEYLKKIGVQSNVSLVADGAFVMLPETVETEGFWPTEGESGVLGFNISPLIHKFRPSNESPSVLQAEVVSFIEELLARSGVSILLVPHVDPLDGAVENSDSHYMQMILGLLKNAGDRVKIAPNNLNAAQLKFVISRCRYFIGARTHATIGALSCGVPTVSISYSIKAKGINRDLFGDERLVLDTSLVSHKTLLSCFDQLVIDGSEIRGFLVDKLPDWKRRAFISAQKVGDLFELQRS